MTTINNVTVDYQLFGTGWAEFYLKIDQFERTIIVSYIGDGLNGLLEYLTDLISEIKNNGKTEQEKLYFDSEGANHILTISSINKIDAKIELAYYEDSSSKGINPKENWIMFCKFHDLVKAITEDAILVLKKHGLMGYAKTWSNHSDFPIYNLFQLINWTKSGELDAEINYEEGGFFSNFKNEINILSEL